VNKRVLYIILLVIMVVVLIMPMLTHNSVVQSVEASSDMGMHLGVIYGENHSGYYGAVILGYILRPIFNSGSLDTVYLWFNFMVLIAVALGLIYITRRLVNKEASMLVVPVVLFCTTGILALFKYGVIFNIINMYLVLLFALYFTVKWFVGGKYWNAIVAVALFALFSVTHYTSLYLPYVIGLAVVLSVAYVISIKKSKYLKKIIPFGAVVISLNLVLSFMFINETGEYHQQAIPFLWIPKTAEASSLVPASYDISIGSLFLHHLSLITIGILAISAVGFFLWRKEVVLSQSSKLFLFILGCFIVVLSYGVVMGVVDDINRIAIDLATIIAIFTACVVGVLLKVRACKWTSLMLVAIVAIGAVPNIIAWVR